MTKMDIVDPVLRDFTADMRRKLALPKNLKKGSWRLMSQDQLLHRLTDEVIELSAKIKGGSPPIAIREEAADVANFAMFIADNAMRPKEAK